MGARQHTRRTRCRGRGCGLSRAGVGAGAGWMAALRGWRRSRRRGWHRSAFALSHTRNARTPLGTGRFCVRHAGPRQLSDLALRKCGVEVEVSRCGFRGDVRYGVCAFGKRCGVECGRHRAGRGARRRRLLPRRREDMDLQCRDRRHVRGLCANRGSARGERAQRIRRRRGHTGARGERTHRHDISPSAGDVAP